MTSHITQAEVTYLEDKNMPRLFVQY